MRLLVVLAAHGDAGDEMGDARGLLASGLGVLQIDVVDDIGDLLQRRIGEPGRAAPRSCSDRLHK
ncbi:MAG: hypothetical protein ACRC67_03105 [Inquilinus sp.]|uniref:hypothetical protein n=1 Tax=Inquilinus sp. TaxID=1932117 RepID=UPI003F2F78C3